MVLLSLSKKSNRRILWILTLKKIHNLQAAECGKNVKFWVFRQARYVHGISEKPKSFDIPFIYAIMWANYAVLIMAR